MSFDALSTKVLASAFEFGRIARAESKASPVRAELFGNRQPKTSRTPGDEYRLTV